MNPAGFRQVTPPSLPLPPAPLIGSPRYFALLYTQAPLRPVLTTLLALADEISAGAGRGLDHSVAHVRLDWWRLEAERYERGQPQHPWLRASLAWQPAVGRLNLLPLLEAAASDLATETLSARPGAALQGAAFALAATVLRARQDAATSSPALQRLLSELGQRACELERFATGRLRPQSSFTAATAARAPAASLDATLQVLRAQAEGIDGALQPPLAPLLVWIALAARQAQRSAGTKSASGLAAFTDNIAAWRAARRALRGHFRIDR